MSFSLHDMIVPAWTQVLAATVGLIDKAQAHCESTGMPPEELIGAQLAADMFPFAYQIKSVAVHSLGAIEGVRKGIFGPDRSTPPGDFASLRLAVSAALDGINALDPAEVNGFVGQDMRFEIGEYRLDFTAENFLTSFSQPNLFFHATTAYGLLRMKGVAVGKRDFLGQMRLKA